MIIVGDNNSKVEGAMSIGKMLRVNKSLNELWLGMVFALDVDFNHLGDLGAACIGEALIENNGLKKLNLSTNNIGNAGIAGISKGLEANTCLTHLMLRKKQSNNRLY